MCTKEKEKVEGWFKEARELSAKSDYAGSAQCYSNILLLEPLNLYAWSCKANALRYSKQIEPAMECCDKIIQIDKNYHYAWERKADMLLELNRETEYTKLMEGAERICRNPSFAWIHQGRRCERQGLPEKALQFYAKATGSSSDAWLHISRLHANGKKMKEAIEACDKYIEADSTAFAYTHKAEMLLQWEAFQEALECASKAVEMDEESLYGWLAKMKACKRLNLGELYLRCLRRLIQLEPEEKRYWWRCAKALYDIGRKEVALEFLDWVLKLDRSFHKAHHLKGVIFKEGERFEEALSCFTEAVAARSYYSDPSETERAVILCYLGRTKEAMDVLLVPTDSEVINLNIGMVYLFNGRFKKAANSFSECTKISPNNEWAKLGNAFILDFRGDTLTAERLIGECSTEKVDWFKRRLTQSYTNEKVGNVFKEWVSKRPAASLDSHSKQNNPLTKNIQHQPYLAIISFLILFYLLTHFYHFGLSLPFLSNKT